jgi:hypothetical protein
MVNGRVAGLGTWSKDSEAFTGIVVECSRDELWKSDVTRLGDKVIVQSLEEAQLKNTELMKCHCGWGFKDGDPFGEYVIREYSPSCRIHCTPER